MQESEVGENQRDQADVKQVGDLMRSEDESPQAVEEEGGEDVEEDQEETEDEQPMRPRYSVRTKFIRPILLGVFSKQSVFWNPCVFFNELLTSLRSGNPFYSRSAYSAVLLVCKFEPLIRLVKLFHI